MRVRFKEGVVFALMDERLLKALPKIVDTWLRVLGEIPTITSARDGDHSENSLHYEGRAIDLRTRHLSYSQQVAVSSALKTMLGANYDVLLERTHMHIELDRRADKPEFLENVD